MRETWISCLANPSVGREAEWGGDVSEATASPGNHGGWRRAGGLELARVAAERGHKVTLAERSAELGGQFRLAAGQPERGEIGELLNWYQTQLEKLQVRIQMRTEVALEDIENADADAVVLCTGSVPTRSGFQRAMPHMAALPGADQDNVCTVHDILDGSVVPGMNVLLIDDLNGWWPASGTALHLGRAAPFCDACYLR